MIFRFTNDEKFEFVDAIINSPKFTALVTDVVASQVKKEIRDKNLLLFIAHTMVKLLDEEILIDEDEEAEKV